MESLLKQQEVQSTNVEDRLLDFVKAIIAQFDAKTRSEHQRVINDYNRSYCILCIGRDKSKLQLLSYVFGHHLVLTRKDQNVHVLRPDTNLDMVGPETAFRLFSNYSFEDGHLLRCLKFFKLPTYDSFLEYLLSFNTNDNELAPGSLVVNDLTYWIQGLPQNENGASASENSSDQSIDKILNSVQLTCIALKEAIAYCGSIYSGHVLPFHRRPNNQHVVSLKALLVVTLDVNHFFSMMFPNGQPVTREAEEMRIQLIDAIANEAFFDKWIDIDLI